VPLDWQFGSRPLVTTVSQATLTERSRRLCRSASRSVTA